MAETRVITQVRIYTLILNPMTGRTEGCQIAAISDDYQKLINWIKGERNPDGRWNDGGWFKEYKKDSILEWFNPPDSIELNDRNHWGHGIIDEWITEDFYKKLVSGEDNRFYFIR